MNKIIEMKSVHWQRDKKPILEDINWSVEKGEHWAVLGLNGSGKTTLLNMLNGYIWPTTGIVTVLGEKFGNTDIHKLRKRIGWVSSSLQSRIDGNTRGEDVVISGKFASTGLYDNPTEEDYEKAFGLMKTLNIQDLEGSFYETCSQGERQKLLIARGLMADPELFILDEPTNGLDFLSREELLETIEKFMLEPNAPTIIFVTHHIEEILPNFTHTLLLEDGHVFSKGGCTELLTSEHLTSFFKKPVQIDWRQNRAWLSLI